MIERALRIDPDQHVETRLANLIAQRRARWLLGRIDELFLEAGRARAKGEVKCCGSRLLCSLLGLPDAPALPQIVIKMGTLAPEGSPWHQVLQLMGERWRKISGGQVKLMIYPGGVLGDEPDLVNKMRIGQIQAVALSGAGMSDIEPGVMALQIPMMFESYEELDYVRDEWRRAWRR